MPSPAVVSFRCGPLVDEPPRPTLLYLRCHNLREYLNQRYPFPPMPLLVRCLLAVWPLSRMHPEKLARSIVPSIIALLLRTYGFRSDVSQALLARKLKQRPRTHTAEFQQRVRKPQTCTKPVAWRVGFSASASEEKLSTDSCTSMVKRESRALSSYADARSNNYHLRC